MKLEKVSIIIPIYNVEKHLCECIDSVLQQTYANLQIILVDDGSSDSCGAICNSYNAKDNRVLTIHKENGGLSDARNIGVSYADGDFVFYLDGDDYLESNAVETFLDAQRRTNADIVVGNYYYTYSNREDVAATIYDKETELDNYSAMRALISGHLQTFAWGKLIRAETAKKYLFPKGKVFEDHYWTHFVFVDAKKVVVLCEPLVHYRQRDDSISYTFNMSRLDVLEGWLNRKAFIEAQYPELVELCMKQYSEQYVGIAWLILTRMKHDRNTAFNTMRKYNALLHLQDYSDGINHDLICALNRENFSYAVKALWYRLKRGR